MTITRAATTITIGTLIGWLLSLAAMYVVLGYLGEMVPGLRDLRLP